MKAWLAGSALLLMVIVGSDGLQACGAQRNGHGLHRGLTVGLELGLYDQERTRPSHRQCGTLARQVCV